MKYLVANWKGLKDEAQCCRWLEEFSRECRSIPGLMVVLCPPLTSLRQVAEQVEELRLDMVRVAVQDISPFPSGDYTGAVPAKLVRPFASHALIGHRDRRQYFREDERHIVNKVEEAVDAGIIPILCLPRGEGLNLLYRLQDIEIPELLLALGPEKEINFNIPENPVQLAAEAAKIVAKNPGWKVLYDGCLPAAGPADFLGRPELSGLLVTRESLEPEQFLELCRQVPV